MLKHITISQYAIVESLDMDFQSGMTVITGETGAGKSIMLDALGLCLGDRADARTVRPGAKRAEVTATFDVTAIPAAQAWLEARDLDADDECILRRTVTADGRSKAFINGSPSTLNDCAELGELLVDIHSQHAHQSLLRKATQRDLLDAYGCKPETIESVAQIARNWRDLSTKYQRLSADSGEIEARRELLAYQVEELDNLDCKAGEVEELEAEQKTLSNATYILESAGAVADGCEQQLDQLRTLRHLIEDDKHPEAAVKDIRELLSSAQIQLEEARSEVNRYADRVEIDPERLKLVSDRLTEIYDLARKHRVMPEQLHERHAELSAELDALGGGCNDLEAMFAELQTLHQAYTDAAKKLSKQRATAGKKLAKKTEEILAKLAMSKCRLEVGLDARDGTDPHPNGLEDIEFLISTNPGAAPGPLNKVASGGELSRVSLALQVVAADSVTTPTMIFDEVDVGIGGAVAEVVGELLQALSAKVQVLCVTHLPQVASKGHNHLQVSKGGDDKKVTTAMQPLDADGRVEEIARMLGGVKITDATRTSAKEMLAS